MRQADQLIDCIYQALLGTWSEFVEKLVAPLPDGKGMLFFYDDAVGRGVAQVSHGMDSKQQSAFNDYYSRINPLMAKATLRPAGLGTVSERMCPWDTFNRTEFYNDFFKPMRTNAAVGLTVVKERRSHFFVTGMTSQVDPNANQPHADVLSLVAPHLKRAFDFYRRSVVQDALAGWQGSLLGDLNVGAILVGEHAAPLTMNEAAKRHLESGNAVKLKSGRVEISNEGANRLLQQMCNRGSNSLKTGVHLVKRNRLTLVRLKKTADKEFFQGSTVVVLVEPLFHDIKELDLEFMRTAFGLTVAETRVMGCLLRGKSAAEIAEERGLSVETVRTQTKTIYSKLGVHGHVELLAVVRRTSLRLVP